MPETRSELRDCLRTNWGPVQKYADEIVQLVKRKAQSSREKVEQRKKDNHVMFEDVPAAKNPDAEAYYKKVAQGVTSDVQLTRAALPSFDVKPLKVEA